MKKKTLKMGRGSRANQFTFPNSLVTKSPLSLNLSVFDLLISLDLKMEQTKLLDLSSSILVNAPLPSTKTSVLLLLVRYGHREGQLFDHHLRATQRTNSATLIHGYETRAFDPSNPARFRTTNAWIN